MKGRIHVSKASRLTPLCPCVWVRFAGKFEWYTSWLLAADDQGLLRKEAVRAIYDG